MPPLEPWVEKAIGRKPRYPALSLKDTFVNGTLDFISEAGNNYIDKQLKLYPKESLSKIMKKSGTLKTIKGKDFNKPSSLGSNIMTTLLTIGAKYAHSTLENASKNGGILNIVQNGRKYPKQQTIADAVFNDTISFDAIKCNEMLNTCGYVPDFESIIKQNYNDLSNSLSSNTDVQWRKEIMPHILKTTYEEELEKTFTSIRERYTENKTLLSRGMMRVAMRKAAQLLGELFEDYSTKIANQTEFLEAPISIYPKNFDMPNLLNDEEQEKWKNVTRTSLFATTKDLDQKIKITMAPYKQTAARVQDVVETIINRNTKINAVEKPYVVGENLSEDEIRYRSSVSTVRDLKRAYKKRSFFAKWFTPEGWRQRGAVSRLSEKLLVFGKSKETLENHLNLKTELGKEFDDTSMFNLKQHKYVEPSPIKTLTENVAELAGVAYDGLWKLGTSATVSKVASKVASPFTSVYNYFSSKNEEEPFLLEGLSPDEDFFGDREIIVDNQRKPIGASSSKPIDINNSKPIDINSSKPIDINSEKFTQAIDANDVLLAKTIYADKLDTVVANDEVFVEAVDFDDVVSLKKASTNKIDVPINAEDESKDVYEDAVSVTEEASQGERDLIVDDGKNVVKAMEKVAESPIKEALNINPEDVPAEKNLDESRFENELNDAVKKAGEHTVEAQAKASYVGSLWGSVTSNFYNTPSQDFLSKVEEKQRYAIDQMAEAQLDNKELSNGVAQFLYYKTIQNAVKPDFTQKTCDMFAEKFLDYDNAKKGIDIIQKSSAFKKVFNEKIENNPNFQIDLDLQPSTAPKLMNLYMEFNVEKARQVDKQSKPSQHRQTTVKQPSTEASRDNL